MGELVHTFSQKSRFRRRRPKLFDSLFNTQDPILRSPERGEQLFETWAREHAAQAESPSAEDDIESLKVELSQRGLSKTAFLACSAAVQASDFRTFRQALDLYSTWANGERAREARPAWLLRSGFFLARSRNEVNELLAWTDASVRQRRMLGPADFIELQRLLQMAHRQLLEEMRYFDLAPELVRLVKEVAIRAVANSSGEGIADSPDRPSLVARRLVGGSHSFLETLIQAIEEEGAVDEHVVQPCRRAFAALSSFIEHHDAFARLDASHRTSAQEMASASAVDLAAHAANCNETEQLLPIFEQLVKKQEYEYIAQVWADTIQRNLPVTSEMLAGAAVAFIHLGDTELARDLLQQRLAVAGTSPDEAALEGKVRGDARLLRMTVKALASEGSYEALFSWLDLALFHYGIEPDASCLDVILSAARSATPLPDQPLPGSQDRRFDAHPQWVGRLPALFGRDVLLASLFSRYPHLVAKTYNPLDTNSSGWVAKGEMSMRRLEHWLLTRFRSRAGTRAQDTKHVKQWQQIAKRDSLIFDARLLQTYMLLLHRLRLLQLCGAMSEPLDIGTDMMHVLAWHKLLRIRPTRLTLSLACLEVARVVPPSSGSSWAGGPGIESAAGPLHGWLENWLGPESVPTEQDCARVWQWTLM